MVKKWWELVPLPLVPIRSVGPVEAYISGLFKKTHFVFNYIEFPDKHTDIAEFWVNPELPVYLRSFYCLVEKNAVACILHMY